MENKKDFQVQREQMVEEQIRGRGIHNERVLRAMKNVPREVFVIDEQKELSYFDGPLPIGCGQTISQPYIVAYMTDLLELKGEERVLEIGTGSGYQTAVLAELVSEVYSLELIEELSERAAQVLFQTLGYTNIHLKVSNGREGWPEFALYDRIIITAAPEIFPENLFDQLQDKGIAVAPVGSYFQRMVQYKKNRNRITVKPLIGVSFVPFI